MDFVTGVVSEAITAIFKTVVQEIKYLVSLPSDALRLRTELKRVEGIVDHIKKQLQGQGREPLPVVKHWLEIEEQIVKFADEALLRYGETKHNRWCFGRCPHCFLLQRSSAKIREALSKVNELVEKKSSDFPKSGELGEVPGTLMQPMEEELVGTFVQEKLSELETWLLQDETVRTIGVYGMPGVGKTSLLKQINNNEKVVTFFKLVIWVTVSKDHDISAMQRRMCDRLGLTVSSNLSIDEAAELLHSVLRQRRLLLILDDVWAKIDVANLGISLPADQIKIVVTSRSKRVCENMKADRTMAMKHLSEEEGWELFRRGAFGGVGRVVPVLDDEIEHFARGIAKECKGHPLAIKTLARTMPRLHQSEPSEWEFVLKQLKAVDPDFYRIYEELLRDLFKPLKRSYDALEPEQLKICFLYLAAYREDEEIDAEELIQLWLAEGLVKNRDQGRHGFLKALSDRCLAEIESKEKNGVDVWNVKVHDVLRDMAIHVAEVDQNALYRAGGSLTEFPDSPSPTLARISVMHNQIRFLPDNLDCTQLVSLLASWNWVSVVPEGFLEKLSLLKVLDLSNTRIKLLPASIGQLKQLVYLQLSNTQIKVLPYQAYQLSRLQFLDLSFSTLKSIPSTIKELKRLQTLRLASCYDLEFVSPDISQLSCLEELDMWKASFAFSWELKEGQGAAQMKDASLQDVCNLHSLKRLRLSVKSPIEEGVMGNLVELKEVWLLWMPEARQTNLPTDMRAMHGLERLHLHECDIEGTPDLFSTLENLKYLELNSCQLLYTLSGLGLEKLRNLREVEVEECIQLKELGEDFGRKGNFPKLRKLKLWRLHFLETLFEYVEEGALPLLHTLAVYRCEKVKGFPQGFDHLRALSHIRGDQEWWKEIIWENKELKNHFQGKYKEICDNIQN